MKRPVAMVLISILLIAFFIPQGIAIQKSENGTFILNLDVCSAHGKFSKSSLDLTYVLPEVITVKAPCVFCYKNIKELTPYQLILPDKKPHPPRA